ncbi:cupin domain-containing protein [Mucilaginibacter pedocola]|uniref:Cupin n=1 Tax=Mucilaginibacter pedocola TaxID=1792845 RepID=A0A1S9P6K7_9SPHI|nr:cupin domain-containing protein [Mucilaginibacter pedocola]OOQ56582.1 cupin [Mucilaginibacter pedocola]
MENVRSMPTVVGPDGGKILAVVGGNYRVLVSGQQTGGAFSTIEMLVPPQNGPGPHSHADFFETFYIVDGEVEVHSEAGTYTAKKGAFVLIPKGGVVHYFKNISDQMTKLLCTVVPAGLEEFFEEIGEPVAAGQFLPPPSMNTASLKRIQDIAKSHGQLLYPPDFLDKR